MPEQRGSPSSKGHPLDEDADDAESLSSLAECSKCSPVFRGGPLTSPIGRIEEKVDDPLQMKEGFSMLRASAWLSHNIGSQASYRCGVRWTQEMILGSTEPQCACSAQLCCPRGR